jgi:hypothetical protein
MAAIDAKFFYRHADGSMAAPLFLTNPILRPAHGKYRADQTAKRPRLPREDIVVLSLAEAGVNMWKTLGDSQRRSHFCVPRFPHIHTTTTATVCFY